MNKKLTKLKSSETSDPSKKYLYNNKIVITGGTSGIGYEVAKMVNKYKPFLVICGKKKNKVQKMYDFKRSPSNTELKSNTIYGGLPIDDPRRANKKTYGISDSINIGHDDASRYANYGNVPFAEMLIENLVKNGINQVCC